MDNYLSRKGYFLHKNNLSKENINSVKKDLSIKPITKNNTNQIIKHYVETDSYFIIPRRYGEEKFGKVEFKNLKIKKVEFNFNGTLKEEQKEPYDIMKKYITENGSGIFSLMTGKGKTVCSIKLMCELGFKTLIVSASVNQIDMLKQWEREIKKFAPGISLGLLQGKNIDCKKDVILSTISSLALKDYPSSYFSGIGLVIIDECFVPWQKIITLKNEQISTETIFNIYSKFKSGHQIIVQAYDCDKNKIVYKKVSNAWEKESTNGLIRLNLEDDSYIDCTPNHKFLLFNGEWKTAEELKDKDCFLYCKNNIINFILLKSKFHYQTTIKVYDLEVEDVHNYVLDCGIIAHNCHHVSSPTYCQILYKIGGSPYLLGLSATPERQDGLTQILKWWTGPPFYSQIGSFDGLNPQVVSLILSSTEYKEIFTQIRGEKTIAFTSMLTDLIGMKNRNNLLVDLLVLLSQTDRQILLLTDRIEHVKFLCHQLEGKINKNLFSPYIGTQMTEQEKKDAIDKKIIIATSKSFGEGIDKKELDTLILATPKKYIAENKAKNIYSSVSFIQIIGRIFRKKHIERHPLIIDLFDYFSVYKNQGYSRNRYYNTMLKDSQIKKLEIDLDKYQTLKKKIVKKDLLSFNNTFKSITINTEEKEEKEKEETLLLSDEE